MEKDSNWKAKSYSKAKYALVIADTLFLLLILVIFQVSGLSLALVKAIAKLSNHYYLALAIYLLVIFTGYYLLDFPFNLYRSFILEHKFNLCNQKFKHWLIDQFKSMLISFLIFIILAEAFYYILNRFPSFWWIVASLFWIFFSVILAKLAPIIIIPLFFKYKHLSDGALRERIVNLANKMKVHILDVFEIDFSKKTLKANAAFVGIGKTKRVILADTLKDRYTNDEIEVILAHEFAHYQSKHLLKLLLFNSLTVIVAFYFIFKTNAYILELFRIPSLNEISALPVILIYLIVFTIITAPLGNFLSRRLEANADRLALGSTGLKSSFISMMEKLAEQNLADRKPSSLIKIFFFDHPPVDERIDMAK